MSITEYASPACPECGSPISLPRLRRHAKTCSTACSLRQETRQWQENNPTLQASTAVVGAIAELRVATDLMLHGYHVFRNMAATGPDLVAWKDDEMYLIEVRTAYATTTGQISYPKATRYEPHWFALVLKTGELGYRAGSRPLDPALARI